MKAKILENYSNSIFDDIFNKIPLDVPSYQLLLLPKSTYTQNFKENYSKLYEEILTKLKHYYHIDFNILYLYQKDKESLVDCVVSYKQFDYKFLYIRHITKNTYYIINYQPKD